MKNKTLKIMLIIFGIIIGMPFLIILGLAVSWSYSDTHGPYHYAATVETIYDVEKLGEKQFCVVNYDLYELKDGSLEEVDIGSNAYIYNIKSYNNKLYVNVDKKSIQVFNSELEKEETINIWAKSFFVDDDYIYHLYNLRNEETNAYYDLFVYDFETEECMFVATDVRNNTVQFNEKTIYIDDEFKFYDVTDDSKIYSYVTPSSYSSDFYANGNIGRINTSWETKGINIKYEEEIYEIEQEERQRIYDIVHVDGNKVIFASYDYLYFDNCENSDCICHYGSSHIWCFNIETKETTKLHTLDEDIYLISFDETNYCYYKSGKIYRNNQEIGEVEKVIPHGKYTYTNWRGNRDVSNSYFYDGGNEVYCLFKDYKDTIEYDQ